LLARNPHVHSYPDSGYIELSDVSSKDVIFVTGVPGAGKSTAFQDEPDDNVLLIYEKNFSNPDASSRFIDAIIMHGCRPAVTFVYADLVTCFRRVVNRTPQTGRVVDIDYLVRACLSLPECLRELKAKYGESVRMRMIKQLRRL
jgi:hypothetical protein